MDYKISFYLDTRRALKDEKFPLKLRVWNANSQSEKLFKTPYYFGKADYENILSSRTKKMLQADKIMLNEYISKANEVAAKIKPFNFSTFLSHFGRKRITRGNLIDIFNEKIAELESNDQVKNASSYRSSLNSLKKYINGRNPNAVTTFLYTDLDLKFLLAYKAHLYSRLSISSVGSYLRPLKAIYNIAFDENDNLSIQNPFKDKKFQIPSSTKVHKALTRDALVKLKNSCANNVMQEKARNFWFLSFYFSGMNINDIARLKVSDFDMENDVITKHRNKVLKSTQTNLQPLIIQVNDEAKRIIEKYMKENKDGNGYLFDILDEKDNEKEIVRKIEKFCRFINQHIKKLADSCGVDHNISVQYARHTFATLAIHNGANTITVRDFLGHKDTRTTDKYIANLITDEKIQIMKRVFDLD